MSRYASEQQEEIIDELGKRLCEGSKLFNVAKDKYEHARLAPWIVWWVISWNPATKAIDQCKKWYVETLEYLESKYSKSVYSNQFENVPEEIIFNEEEGRNTRFLKTFQKRLIALEKIIYALTNKVVIDVKSRNKKEDGTLLYSIEGYSDSNRSIRVNGIEIGHPNFESENDQFFRYVDKNRNRTISIEELEKVGITKPITKMINELGFKGAYREVFFPSAGKAGVIFRNPITIKCAEENNLPTLKIG